MKKLISYIFLFIISFFLITEVKASGFLVEDFQLKEKSNSMEVENIDIDNNVISSNVRFNEKDDYAVFEFNLINDETKSYKIDKIEDNNDNEHIKITYNYSKSAIEANNSTLVTVTMKYNDQLLNVDKEEINNLKISVKLKEVNKNPQTFDNILIYVTTFIISTVILFLLVKKYKKVSLAIILLVLISLPSISHALDEILVEITFNSIEVIGEFENYGITVDEANGHSYVLVITYGQPVGALEQPQKTGYNFVGWEDDDGNPVTENTIIEGPITINAVYSIIKYNITYELNGGSADNVSEYTVLDQVILANPIKDFYTFIGWTSDDNNTPEKDLVIPAGTIGDKTFEANYEPYKYTIIFNSSGGTGTMSSFEAEYGEEYELPENKFTYLDKAFIEWVDDDGNKYADKDSIKNLVTENNGTITLYAVWKDAKRITLKAGYGIQNMTFENLSGKIFSKLVPIDRTITLDEIELTYIDDFSGIKAYLMSEDGEGNTVLTEIESFTVEDSDAEILIDPAYPKKCYCNNLTMQSGTECEIGSYTYKYKYKASASSWTAITDNGWGIKITDKTSTSPVNDAACGYINDKPLVNTMHAFNSAKATSIDLSGWYFKNVNQTTYMFNKAQATELIGLSNLDVSGVANMGGTFSAMPNIKVIDITGWDTRNATNFNIMFQKSTQLETIYVGPNFDVSNNNQNSGNKMFEGCTSLVGGAGTVYSSSNHGVIYARIDDPENGKPGYLTQGPRP